MRKNHCSSSRSSHRPVAPPARAVDHLLVRQHGLAARAPVDDAAPLVGQVARQHAEEEELLPAVVARVAGGELARPSRRRSRAGGAGARMCAMLSSVQRAGCAPCWIGGVLRRAARRRPSRSGAGREIPPCGAGARSRRRSCSCGRAPCGCRPTGTGTSRARSTAARPDRRRRRRRARSSQRRCHFSSTACGSYRGAALRLAPLRRALATGRARPTCARDVVEHAVHERRRFLAAEPARDLDRLVQRDRRRDLRPRRSARRWRGAAGSDRRATAAAAASAPRRSAISASMRSRSSRTPSTSSRANGPRLRVRRRVEVLPEERQAPALLRPSPSRSTW